MKTIPTYAVFTCNDPAGAKVNLSAHDVIRHIYRYDGADYRIEPKMVGNFQDTYYGDLLFKVSFKTSGNSVWESGGWCLASGKNEIEAEAQFLEIYFNNRLWDTSYWIVLAHGDLTEIMDRYTTAIAIAQQD